MVMVFISEAHLSDFMKGSGICIQKSKTEISRFLLLDSLAISTWNSTLKIVLLVGKGKYPLTESTAMVQDPLPKIRCAFDKFPDVFVQAFKIVVDSWQFTMLLLYIL